jgi:acetyltransferase-like isoleucine patch superfamily enzyme
VEIGDDVQIGQAVCLGQSSRIGNGVFVGAHTIFSDNRYAIRSVEDDLDGPLIEDFVRIGVNCVVLPGVRIGHNALIGASAVVTKDVPPGVVALGSPCRPVRDLAAREIDAYRVSVCGGAD